MIVTSLISMIYFRKLYLVKMNGLVSNKVYIYANTEKKRLFNNMVQLQMILDLAIFSAGFASSGMTGYIYFTGVKNRYFKIFDYE